MEFKALLLVFVVGASFALGADPSTTTAAPAPTSDAPVPETTKPPPPPPTTTAAPNTTTAASTTSEAPTPAPTTTPAPSPAPTTAPTPTPDPAPERGNWTVASGTEICIIAQMVVSSKISYPLQTPNKTGNVEVKVPKSATATGVCNADAQNITITWGDNNLEIAFGKNATTKVYYVTNISFTVMADNKTFPNISSEWLNKSLTFAGSFNEEFMTNLNQSYRCGREESLILSLPNSKNNDAVLVLNKVQLQAFHTDSQAVFGEAQDCELNTPDIVPIAVGCALAGLVLIVLVAYLVGRRRSQARGYLSM